jgi:hypothetical protein
MAVVTLRERVELREDVVLEVSSRVVVANVGADEAGAVRAW